MITSPLYTIPALFVIGAPLVSSVSDEAHSLNIVFPNVLSILLVPSNAISVVKLLSSLAVSYTHLTLPTILLV